MLSVVELLGCKMAVPNHTTVSRRAMALPSIDEVHVANGPLHVLIDSPGSKVYGAGEWLVKKSMARIAGVVGASCTWRWTQAAGRSYLDADGAGV